MRDHIGREEIGGERSLWSLGISGTTGMSMYILCVAASNSLFFVGCWVSPSGERVEYDLFLEPLLGGVFSVSLD